MRHPQVNSGSTLVSRLLTLERHCKPVFMQGLLVFRNSDQFERLMHLDGVVSECGGDILPSVQSQQIQDGIANAG